MNINDTIKNYKELKQFIDQLTDELDTAKAAIIEEMTAAGMTEVKTDLFTVKYTEYQSNRIDTTSLKKELPEVAERYSKTVTAHRLMVA